MTQNAKLITLTMMLIAICMFRIENKQNHANDIHYTSTSQRKWSYWLISRMYTTMENMLTKLEHFTQKYMIPHTKLWLYVPWGIILYWWSSRLQQSNHRLWRYKSLQNQDRDYQMALGRWWWMNSWIYHTKIILCFWGRSQTPTTPTLGPDPKGHQANCWHQRNNGSYTRQWNQRQFQRTVPLDNIFNVASFSIAPWFRRFEAYEATAGFDHNYNSDPITSQEAHIIEDEESANTNYQPTNPWMKVILTSKPTILSMDMNKPLRLQKTIQGIPIDESEDNEVTPNATLLL